MKNMRMLFHSLSGIFKETRLVCKNKAPENAEYKKASEHFKEGPIDTIESKKEKLAATSILLNDAGKIKHLALSTHVEVKDKTLSERTMLIGVGNLAAQVYPNELALQRKQTIDFIKAFEESDAKNITTVDEEFVIFAKDKSEESITIYSSKDGQTKGKKLGSFNVESSIRKEIEANRDKVISGIMAEARYLSEEQANIEVLQAKALNYRTELIKYLKIDPKAIDTVKEKMILDASPEKVEFIIHKLDEQGRPMATMTKVSFTYVDGEFAYEVHGPSNEQRVTVKSSKFETPTLTLIESYIRSWEVDRTQLSQAEISGKELVAKAQVNGKDEYLYVDIDKEGKTKFYFADNREVTDLSIIAGLANSDIKTALETVTRRRLEQRAEQEKIVENTAQSQTEGSKENTAKDTAEIPAEATTGNPTEALATTLAEALAAEPEIQTVTVDQIEVKRKKVKESEVTSDPDSGRRILTVTTKRGTKLVYRETETRTKENQAIWRYSDTDEYYTDDGKRVDTQTGLSYTGSGQKESVIIGKHVKINRNLVKDLSESLGAKVKLSKETLTKVNSGSINETEKTMLTQGPLAIKTGLTTIFQSLKEGMLSPPPPEELRTLDGLVKSVRNGGELLRTTLSQFDKISVNINGVTVEWTKENGFFKPEDPTFLTIKVIQLLKVYLEPSLYEEFMEKDRSVRHEKETKELRKRTEMMWRQEYLSKLGKTYKTPVFGDRSFSEEDISENWKLLNGNARITEILTRNFAVSSSAQGLHGISEHEVPQVVGKIISEWKNTEVKFSYVLKFVSPNLSVFTDEDAKTAAKIMGEKSLNLKEYLSEPKKILEILDKGLNGPHKNDLMVQEFMDKVFNNIVNPTIDLLESMERLTVSEAKKIEDPKTAEEMIWELMKNEPYSSFSLESGNKFKLKDVSPYKNSENLNIGIGEGIVESTTPKLLEKINQVPELAQYENFIKGLDNKLLLQAVFLSVSPENLAQQNCLQRNTNNEILLVKLPIELTENPEYIIDRLITIKEGKSPESDNKTSDIDVLRNKLDIIDKQKRVLKQLEKLCKTEDERNWLKSTVDWFKGVGDFVYMTQLDGSTVFKDKSRLDRQMTGEGALNFMLHNGDYYKIDQVRDIKILDVESLQKDVNKFIKLGALQKFMSEGGSGNEAPTEEEVAKALEPGSEFNKYLKTLTIRNLETDIIRPDQVKAFQMGLLVEYTTRYDKQNEDLLQSTKNPILKEFMKWAISTGATKSQIKEAVKKLVVIGGGVEMGTNGEILGGGVGAGVTIPLGNGFSFTTGVATNFGGIEGAIGVSCTFKGPGNSEWTVGVMFSAGTSGVGGGAGAMNVHRYGKTAYEGMAMAAIFSHSSTGFIPLGNLGYGVGRNYNYAVEIKMEENVKEAKFEEIQTALEKFDKGGENAKKELLEAAKKHPSFRKLFDAKIAGSSLSITEDDIISLIRFQLMGMQEKSARNASQSLAKTDWVPVSKVVLGVPCSYIEFSLPMGTVSRPLLRSEARVLGIASSMAVESSVDKELRERELTGMYVENISDVYITADGRVGSLTKEGRKEIDFSSLGDNNFLNKELKKIDMRVKENLAGTERTLQINDSKKVELEVHVDPLLRGEFAVQANADNTLSLKGNIEDLVITRERFFFPAVTGKYGSSVKDVVTIRKKKSARADRDRLWIMEYEESFLERLPGHTWAKKEGVSAVPGAQSKTVFDLRGWNSTENEQTKRALEEARKKEMTTEATDTDLKEKAEASKEALEGMPKTKFEKTEENVQQMIKEDIDKLFEQGTKSKFYKAIATRIDDPRKLSQYLASQEADIFSENLLGEDGKLSDLERNLAVQYVTRRYFIDLASKALKESGLTEQDLGNLKNLEGIAGEILVDTNPKLKSKLIKYTNRTREILIKNAKYVAKAFETEFEEAINRLRKRGVSIDENLTGKSVAEQMVKDISGKVPKVDKHTTTKELLSHPLMTMDIESMWEGSTVLYGTHKAKSEEGGRHIPAVARTLQAMATADRTIRSAGLLKGTSTLYEEGSDMEKILVETASPVPELSETAESYKEFLNSEFAVKIANMGALVFMMQLSDYKKAMEAMKDPSLAEKRDYQVSIRALYEICARFRADQLASRPTEIQYKDLTIKIHLYKKARSIAWADCGNAGFETDQEGQVEILKSGEAIVVSRETLERLDPQVRKLYQTFVVGIKLSPKEDEKPTEKEKEKEKGKTTGKVPKKEGGKDLSKTSKTTGKRQSSETKETTPANHPDEQPTNYSYDTKVTDTFK